MIKRLSQDGFTLIEVLVALVVLAIAMMAIIKVTHQAVTDTIHVRQRVIAHWVAMNLLSDMQVDLMPFPSRGQVLQGKSDLLDSVWDWKVGRATKADSWNNHRVFIDVSLNDVPVEHLEGFVRAK